MYPDHDVGTPTLLQYLSILELKGGHIKMVLS
jgi:hypothetical protein